MKVVFLDIDGVLQPFSKKVRVNYINNDIISLLNNKYHINYNRYDKVYREESIICIFCNIK